MTLHTKLYNLLHTGNPGDIVFYRKCCKAGQSVLELGCGNGRIAKALAEQGCQVVGLDNDVSMLDAFQRNVETCNSRPIGILGDMRSFDLDRKFDKIIIPFNGLLCLLSLADVEAAFRCCAAHLNPGGELIFDIYYVPDDFENDGIEEEAYVDTAVVYDGDLPIEVYEKTLANKDPQRFDTSYIFVKHPNSSMESQTELVVQQRCLYIFQIKALLAQVGFKKTTILEGFSGHPVGDDTEQITVRASS